MQKTIFVWEVQVNEGVAEASHVNQGRSMLLAPEMQPAETMNHTPPLAPYS